MIADKLAALREAALTPPGEDDDYAEVVLQHGRGSSGFSENGAEAVAALINDAAPALEALVRAAEEIKALDEIPSPITEDRAGLYRRAWSAHLAAIAELDKVLS